MKTMMVNKFCVRAPIESPIVATMTFGRSACIHGEGERQRFRPRQPTKLAPFHKPRRHGVNSDRNSPENRVQVGANSWKLNAMVWVVLGPWKPDGACR